MGDKSGHFTAEYFRNPENMVKLEYIQENLGVSLKIIHVLRNPFDVLSTRLLRLVNARDSASPEDQVNKTLCRSMIKTHKANKGGRRHYI